MNKSLRFLLLVLLITIAITQPALACRTSRFVEIVTFAQEISEGYGRVGSAFLAGALYLQVRRSGFNTSTWLLAIASVGIYWANPGWHFNGRRGDCGTGEVNGAHEMMIYLGAFFVLQIALTLVFLWRRANKGRTSSFRKLTTRARNRENALVPSSPGSP